MLRGVPGNLPPPIPGPGRRSVPALPHAARPAARIYHARSRSGPRTGTGRCASRFAAAASHCITPGGWGGRL